MATVTAPPPKPQPAAGPAAKPTWIQRNHFILRRIHSLTGIVPVGGYLLYHFYENGSIFYGKAAYDEMATGVRGIRYLEVMEIFILLLPILYHSIYGIFIASYARNNTMSYNYSRNNLFMWQRATGVVVMLFLLYHIWEFRITSFWTTHADTHTVGYAMSYWPTFLFYVIGVTAASFHLGNGIWTFLITWGITIGQRSQRLSQVVTTGISLLASAVGVAICIAFVVQNGGFR